MNWLSKRLRYSNVMSTLAVFIALGGASYAAVTLPKNSVGSKQIKNGQVKHADLGKNSVTSTNVKDGSLLSADFKAGQIPAGPQGPQGPQGVKGDTGPATGPAGGALTGNYPDPGLKQPEAFHTVGAAGEPAYQNNFSSSSGGSGFYKDPFGRVFFFGYVERSAVSGNTIFTLPAGYRPSIPRCISTNYHSGAAYICVFSNGNVDLTQPGTGGGVSALLLDGLSFRAEQ